MKWTWKNKKILPGMFLILGILFSGITAIAAQTDKISVGIAPEILSVGTYAQLILTSTDGGRATLKTLPEIENIRWEPTPSIRSYMSNSNGVVTNSIQTIYTFVPLKAGTYRFPGLEITTAQNKITTAEFEFAVEKAESRKTGTAGKNGGDLTLGDVLFAQIRLMTDQKKFYVGEEIPLEIKVWQMESMEAEFLSFPEIGAGKKANIVFKDFGNANRENRNFDAVSRVRQKLDGMTFQVYTFRTALRSISPGTLELHATIPMAIYLKKSAQDRSSFFDDPFFSSVFSRGNSEKHTLTAETGKIDIIPLPPVPSGKVFLGLTGNWELNFSLNKTDVYRVGEPITLTVAIKGQGSLETLNAPTLELPDFRVYPPEIEKNLALNTAELRYILIPTKQGSSSFNIKFSTFDTASGKYEEKNFVRQFEIEKSNSVFSGNTGKHVVDSGNIPYLPPLTENQDEKKNNSGGLLYLHKNLDWTISLPLHRNALLLSALMISFGVCFYLACLIAFARKRALENDPAMKRRIQARTRKTGILKKLKASPPEELAERTGIELGEYLNDMLNLPNGSSLGETAKALKEKAPELAESLERLAESEWMPSIRNSFDQNFKEKLLKTFSRFSVIVVLLFAGIFGTTVSAAEKEEEVTLKTASVPRTEAEALTAYDSGDFQKALNFYASLLDRSNVSPALLYNIGNCYYHLGDLSRALVCYERALRLSPRNSDIQENLNLTRRKLLLAEKYKIETPSALLPYFRDSLRMDEWIKSLAFGIMVILIGLGLRSFTKGIIWKPLLLAGFLIAVMAGISIYSQSQSTYSERYALVTTRNAPLYSLPSEQSGKVELKLKAGQELSIEERRMDWVRVRVDNDEGWMKAEDIAPLWTKTGIDEK